MYKLNLDIWNNVRKECNRIYGVDSIEISLKFGRYIHYGTSHQCLGLWKVPSKIVSLHGSLLDGRQYGDYDIEHSKSILALRLGHF